MSHAFDDDLMFLKNATVTQAISTGPVSVWGGIERGLAVRVVVGNSYGANDTMLPKVYVSADGTNYTLVSQHSSGGTKVYGGREFIVPFPVNPGRNYVKLELAVTATTKSYTGVYAGIVPNPGFDYDRNTHWE